MVQKAHIFNSKGRTSSQFYNQEKYIIKKKHFLNLNLKLKEKINFVYTLMQACYHKADGWGRGCSGERKMIVLGIGHYKIIAYLFQCTQSTMDCYEC